MKLLPIDPSKSIIQELQHTILDEAGVQLFVKREDLIHPQVSGNKWRKLKYNIEHALTQQHSTLLTFGGAFSNHILATAAVGKLYDFQTIGIIRGEEHLPLNSTLEFAKSCDMKLQYMDRSTYRKKNTHDVLDRLKDDFGNFYLLPEGGSNTLALKGCAEIMDEIPEEVQYCCVACGTGGTLAGMLSGAKAHQQLIGFPVLKGGDFLKEDILQLLAAAGISALCNWQLQTDYHFGGYAKTKPTLNEFIQMFRAAHGFEIEFVYTAKLFYGIFDLVQKGFFERGSQIMAIHTGGLRN